MEFKFATEVLDAVAVFDGAFVGDVVWSSDNIAITVTPAGATAVVSATAAGVANIVATVITRGGATITAGAVATAIVKDAETGVLTLTVRAI